jgi:hypothetical protein
MKVIFRKDKKTNDIIAFLPEASVNHGNIMCYMHVGQHSEASYNYYKSTIKANESEYLPLFSELNNIYDNELIMKEKLNYQDLINSWK